MKRKPVPDAVRRLTPERFRDVKNAMTPTLSSPGRKRSVAEIRRREIDEELVATLGRLKP